MKSFLLISFLSTFLGHIAALQKSSVEVKVTTLITVTSCNTLSKSCHWHYGSPWAVETASLSIAKLPISLHSRVSSPRHMINIAEQFQHQNSLSPTLGIASRAHKSISARGPHCPQDNCYRAFLLSSEVFSRFCRTYTTDDSPDALTTLALECGGLTSRVSSACTCLIQNALPLSLWPQITHEVVPPNLEAAAINLTQVVAVIHTLIVVPSNRGSGEPIPNLTLGEPVPKSTHNLESIISHVVVAPHRGSGEPVLNKTPTASPVITHIVVPSNRGSPVPHSSLTFQNTGVSGIVFTTAILTPSTLADPGFPSDALLLSILNISHALAKSDGPVFTTVFQASLNPPVLTSTPWLSPVIELPTLAATDAQGSPSTAVEATIQPSSSELRQSSPIPGDTSPLTPGRQASTTTSSSLPSSTQPKDPPAPMTEKHGDAKITSTLTVPPPNFSTLRATRPEWTTNTQITTTQSDGSETILPVIIVGEGVGIIMWGLPPFWNVEISLPELPKFNFPCIPVPGIRKCDNGIDDKPNEEPPRNPDSPASSTKAPQSTPSRTIRSQSIASSTSSSCKEAIVTSCSIFMTYKVNQAESTMSTVTSSTCDVLTACSATGGTTTITTTSMATSKPTYYMIQPNPKVSYEQMTKFTARLRAETDPKSLWVAEAPSAKYLGFWYQKLNETQVAEYRKDPAVISIRSSKEDALISHDRLPRKRAKDSKQSSGDVQMQAKRGNSNKIKARNNVPLDALNQQLNAPTELKAISQPPGVEMGDINSYAYQTEIPGKARIYLVDSGADITDAAWTQLPQVPTPPYFLWPTTPNDPEAPSMDEQGFYNDHNADQHGSSLLAKIVGPKYGVSKAATAVVARIPRPRWLSHENPNNDIRGSAFTATLVTVLEDVVRNNKEGMAVVNLSWGFPADGLIPTPGHGEWHRYSALYELLLNNVVVVVSSGNVAEGGLGNWMNTAPAVWSPYLTLIVVGPVSNEGKISNFARYQAPMRYPNSAVDIWAPGENVEVNGWVYDGSSIATTSVTGLIAYFLGTNGHTEKIFEEFAQSPETDGLEFARVVKEYAKKKAHSRYFGSPVASNNPIEAKMLYNGEVPLLKNDAGFTCPFHPGFDKRDKPECGREAMSSFKSLEAAKIKQKKTSTRTSASANLATITSTPTATKVGEPKEPNLPTGTGKKRPYVPPVPTKGDLPPVSTNAVEPGNAQCRFSQHPKSPEFNGLLDYALITDFIHTHEEIKMLGRLVSAECPKMTGFESRFDKSSTDHLPPQTGVWWYDAGFLFQLEIADPSKGDVDCVLRALRRAGSFSDLHSCIDITKRT